MPFWAKYNTQTTFEFPLIKRGVVDFAQTADYTPAATDSAISKDAGNFADTTNTIAIVGGAPTRGVSMWKIVLSATELQCAVAAVQIVDAATKAIEDQAFEVYTYGNASAMFAGDWSDIVRLGLTALPNASPAGNGGLGTVDANNAMKVQAGSGTGQLDFTAGVVKASIAQILGTALTEVAGQIAGGFKQLFNVASPVATVATQWPDVVHFTNARGDLLSNLDAAVSTRSQPGDAMILSAAYDAAKTASTQASVNAVKTQTDKMTFTVAGIQDVNVLYIHSVVVQGTGVGGDLWRG